MKNSSYSERVKELEKTLQCNCDLDNWEPESDTGHSWVCRIHRIAKGVGELKIKLTPQEKAYDDYMLSLKWEAK